jgi:hypothetical protein
MRAHNRRINYLCVSAKEGVFIIHEINSPKDAALAIENPSATGMHPSNMCFSKK